MRPKTSAYAFQMLPMRLYYDQCEEWWKYSNRSESVCLLFLSLSVVFLYFFFLSLLLFSISCLISSSLCLSVSLSAYISLLHISYCDQTTTKLQL